MTYRQLDGGLYTPIIHTGSFIATDNPRTNVWSLWWPRRLTLVFLIMSNAMDDDAMRWTMQLCDARWGDAMGRCDGRWGDAMDDDRCYAAMRWGYVTIAPSHRRIVHRIASSSIASPHRPSHRPIASPHRASHRCTVPRIASSSIALDIIRNASVSLLGHHRSFKKRCVLGVAYATLYNETETWTSVLDLTWLKSLARVQALAVRWQWPSTGVIDGVEASRIEVVLDWISPYRPSFGEASRSLPAMDVWVEVIDSSNREGGWHAVEMSKPA